MKLNDQARAELRASNINPAEWPQLNGYGPGEEGREVWALHERANASGSAEDRAAALDPATRRGSTARNL